MTDRVEHLDLEDLLALCVSLLGDPPPGPGSRAPRCGCRTPAPSAFGEDAYPVRWTKAAALLHSIVKNHPLVDGNERLGWLACAVFLDLDGIDPTRASNDDVYALVMDVTTNPIEVDELARRLEGIVER